MMDDRTAAKVLGGRPSATDPLNVVPRFRQGVIQDASLAASAGTLTVTLGSDTITPIPGVPFLASYTPIQGDVVWIVQNGTDLVVIGRLNQGDHDWKPFAFAAGQVNVVLSAVAQASAAVVFPAGRFTVAPIVTFGIDSAASSTVSMVRMSGAPTTSGFTAVVNAASAVTATYPVAWMAVQMTPTTAAG